MQNNEQPLTFNENDFSVFSLQKDLVNLFHILNKLSQTHNMDNSAFVDPIKNLVATIPLLSEDGSAVRIDVVGDSVFINEIRVRMDIKSFSAYSSLVKDFQSRKLGAIVIDPNFNIDDIKKFFEMFNNPDVIVDDDPFDIINTFVEQNIENISVQQYVAPKEIDDSQLSSKAIAKKTYFKTISVVNETMDGITGDQVFHVKKAKKVVQKMVDSILQDEATLLELTTLKSHDEYTYNHCVNVCLLSLAMGQRLGYNKVQLGDLGMAALLHDVGKSNIPLEILNKPSKFSDDEWNEMRKHPIYGVKNLLKLKGVEWLSLKIITGSFEHHLNYDLSGYPVLKSKWEVSLYGRIISIVDCYDALTASRVYNRTPFPPDKTLQYMWSKAGSAFDPVLMKLLIRILGIFPIGCLVILNTRELAVVVQNNKEFLHIRSPKVKIINNDGSVSELEDLSQKSKDGRYKKYILKTVEPYKYGINVSDYLLAE